MSERPEVQQAGTATANRRRVIEVALDRRPDLDLAGLFEALALVGIDVDEATLVEDLDALGYEVDDEPEPVAAPPTAVPPAAAPPAVGTASSAAPVGHDGRDDDETDAGPDDDAHHAGPADHDDIAVDRSGHDGASGHDGHRARYGHDDASSPGPGPGRDVVLVLGAACLVLLIGLAALAVHGPIDDDLPGTTRVASSVPLDPDATALAESAEGAAEPGRVTTTVPPTPLGPGTDPELAVEGVLTVDFATPEALVEVPDVGSWELTGEWTATEGVVAIGPTGEDPATAILGLGDPNVLYEARLPVAPAGAGIVFRAAGPDDYWALVSTPTFGTVTVVRVTPEGSESIANTGATAVADGISMGVRMDGPTIEVLVNGLVLATLTDDDPDPGGGVGLYSARATTGASFDDLRILRRG